MKAAFVYAMLGFVAAQATAQSPIHRFDGLVGGGGFGAVSDVGDVDGDGYPDVMVGASAEVSGGSGYVQVFSGKCGNVIFTLPSIPSAVQAAFGWSVSGVGDVNADGYPDMLVGAPITPTFFGMGQAELFSGMNGASLKKFLGPGQTGDRFGFSVSGAGDVNNDGVPDMMVGSPQYDNGFIVDAGLVDVYLVV